MASVNLEFAAYLDPRFFLLGSFSGKSRFDAIGRMGAIWVYCVEKCQPVLPIVMIDALAEVPGYSQWIIDAGLGEAVNVDSIRVKGTEGRIEYLAEARERQKVATEAAARKRKEDRERGTNSNSPILAPILEPNLDPTLVSSSTSASASTSASKEEIHIDQRERRSSPVKSAFDLESAYEMYPRKVGKTKGLKKLAKEIRSQEDFDCLLVAIRHYSGSREVRDGYVRHFSTFVNDWRDWVDPESGTTVSGVEHSVRPLHQVRPV